MSLSRALTGLRRRSWDLREAAFRLLDHVEVAWERKAVEAAEAGIEDLAVLLDERGIYRVYYGGPGLIEIGRLSDGRLGAWVRYSVRSGLYLVGATHGPTAVASDRYEAAELVPGYGPTSLTALCWSPEWDRFREEVDAIRDQMYGGED
ncbi:hypothetical protein [Herbidospora mongoliensis]|uniref:hypothetical protein n=1 Tax=Herbidospora mongoliensis TaxID=688067 RepID=UPI00082B6919|nr:hypothetical protein [Herbidospora mongoliensis]